MLQSLAVGQTITQVYRITITDNNGATISQDITITITGTNDDPTNSAPQIVVGATDAIGAVQEDVAVQSGESERHRHHHVPGHRPDRHALRYRGAAAIAAFEVTISRPLPGFDPITDYFGALVLVSIENPNDTNNIGTVTLDIHA